MTRNLKCFIACAFGKSDIDVIFEKIILKTLKELRITPIRVDKINHNGKIDKKIIDSIERCDLGIAELTYARPSVYYEAGFIEGKGKPVIYLARQDHTIPKEKDTEGNLRVHFDLITQNIILWDKNHEKTCKALNKRIKLVIKPIVEKLNNNREKHLQELHFSRQSAYDRMREIRIATKDFLKFKNVIITNSNHDVFGFRGTEKTKELVYSDLTVKLTPTAIAYMTPGILLERRIINENTHIKKIHLINISLNRVSEKTIRANLLAYKQLNDSKVFHTKYNGKAITITFIDDIKSISDLKKKLSVIL